MEVLGKINDWVWNPMAYFALAVGLYFTVVTGAVQFRLLGDMLRQLTTKKNSAEGTSSLQAVLLTLASRVGVGNIAGVATAITAGGPGALFWMVVCALVGAASAFAESTLAQVFKERIQGEHRGGMPFYVERGLNARWLALILAGMTLAGYGFIFPGVQSNNIAAAMEGAFSIPTWTTAMFVSAILGFVVIGGTRRIVRAGELMVPFMALGYIVCAALVLMIHADQIIPATQLILGSAFGTDQIFGGLMGSAVAWGVRRAVFSNVAGVGEGTFGAASAAVSHPVKQGLVQAFSIFIDTVIVCNATGVMILVTGMYNVKDDKGGFLREALPGVTAGPANTQRAIDSIWPGFGPAFVAIALFFFAFTTLVAFYYIASTSLMYILRDKSPQSWLLALKTGMLAITFFGSIASAEVIWAVGDIGYGTIGWVNMLCLLLLTPIIRKCIKDYDAQRKQGLDPHFDPHVLGIKNAHFWVKNEPGMGTEGPLEDQHARGDRELR